MDKIEKFNNRNLLPDGGSDLERKLSVFDALPDAVSWEFGNKGYSIKNQNKIISVLLEKGNLIAIIEAPFNQQLNKAYIINGRSEIVMDVSNSFKEKYSQLCYNKAVLFTDLYYIGQKLFYFLCFNNSDFRIEIDAKSFSAGDLTESR